VQLQVTQSNAPPTALFNAECNGLTCVLDGSVSLDDKPGLTYAWDLNKFPGGSATGAKVTVTYPHAGSRTVTLTVTDSRGVTSSITKTLAITVFPIAAFTTSCTGLTCTFDSTPSTNNGATIAERIWYFSDGQTAFDELAPSHTFAQAGTYNVTLEILGNNFSTERAVITKQVTVTAPAQNRPPVAQFTVSCLNTTCTFNASGSTDDGGIVSYVWNLDKYPGGSATGATVTVTYPHTGLRNVTLTVRDAQGLTGSITKQVNVVDAPPVAKFTSSCSSLTCTFDASTSTDDVGITSYVWNLDKYPGGSAAGVKVTTTYPHGGTRNVTLTVKDSKGQTSSTTQSLALP
jgi:PKD repeat protein